MLERRFVHSVELRASQGDEGSMIISGYAARFGTMSENLGGRGNSTGRQFSVSGG